MIDLFDILKLLAVGINLPIIIIYIEIAVIRISFFPSSRRLFVVFQIAGNHTKRAGQRMIRIGQFSIPSLIRIGQFYQVGCSIQWI